MPESKHSPGPWTRDAVMSEHLHDIILDYLVPDMGSPIIVANVFCEEDFGSVTLQQANANARLIAAAPDLLAACEAWDLGFTEGEQFDHAQFLAWVNKNRAIARAAIAKAKGK